jgi:hypothetical protein
MFTGIPDRDGLISLHDKPMDDLVHVGKMTRFKISTHTWNGITIRFNEEFGLVFGTDLAYFAEKAQLRTFQEMAAHSRTTHIFTTARTTVDQRIWGYVKRRGKGKVRQEKRNLVFEAIARLNMLEHPMARHTAKK